ncbi:MAG: hypothetical protein VX977_10745 [Pseudomonadota bacterium]|nr:hypothetical protein [Rhodospirillales bacterium]MED5392238.1 hypothetical protein [Pseudomonadota bacterium]
MELVVEQEVGHLARYSFVAVLLHLVGLGPVRATVTYIAEMNPLWVKNIWE